MNTWNSIEFKTFADIQKEHNLTSKMTIARIDKELEMGYLYAHFHNKLFPDMLDKCHKQDFPNSLEHRMWPNMEPTAEVAYKDLMFFDRELQEHEMKLNSAHSCTAGMEHAPPPTDTGQGVSAGGGDRDVPHAQARDIKALSYWRKIRTFFSDKCEGWTLKVPYLLDLHFKNRK